MLSKFIVKIGKNCVACGVCENVCPRGTIKIKNGITSVVDINLCVGCWIYANSCPAVIIDKVESRKND